MTYLEYKRVVDLHKLGISDNDKLIELNNFLEYTKLNGSLVHFGGLGNNSLNIFFGYRLEGDICFEFVVTKKNLELVRYGVDNYFIKDIKTRYKFDKTDEIYDFVKNYIINEIINDSFKKEYEIA